MQFSSPIHLSVYPTICQSVYPFFCPSAVCQCAIMQSSVRPSVCLSVRHMGKSVKTRLNIIGHKFQHSTVCMQSALYAITQIRCPSVCLSVTRAVNMRQHISMYSVYAVVDTSVHPSLTHVRQSKTVELSQWKCITSIRPSICHTVDITFTACRQHVNIATELVISGSTTDSSKLCQIAMIISA